MPDVGLLSGSEPLQARHKVVIRFSVEVDELPVYNESYDVDTVRKELKSNPAEVLRRWTWRLLGAVHCRREKGFSACLTRSLIDGKGCACGSQKCVDLYKEFLPGKKQRTALKKFMAPLDGI
jgi:hypothetical protein